MKVTTTYADGFGRWHAEVEVGGNAIGDDAAARRMAFYAILAEIRERSHTDVLHGVTLTHRTSRDGVLTYYFQEMGAS